MSEPYLVNLYATARRLIKTGDLIAIRGDSLIDRVQRAVTGQVHTHVGVALWVGTETVRRLFVVQQSWAGGDFILADTLRGRDWDVYACPVDRAELEQTVWNVWEIECGYGWGDLVRIGAAKLLTRAGFPGAGARVLPAGDDGRMVCSSRAALLYRLAGWRPGALLPSLPSPGDVVAALGADPVFVYRPEVRNA